MGGHGGMDYIMNYRLMDCLKRGLVPDINVYDAAAWSAPTPLSEASVAQNGAPQKFPDFTRGKWNVLRTPQALRFRLDAGELRDAASETALLARISRQWVTGALHDRKCAG